MGGWNGGGGDGDDGGNAVPCRRRYAMNVVPPSIDASKI